jgi:hypothetical protein
MSVIDKPLTACAAHKEIFANLGYGYMPDTGVVREVNQRIGRNSGHDREIWI